MTTSSAAPCRPGHERLVHLVGHGVGDADGHRRQLAAERSEEQRPEHGVLRGVGDLPQREIPAAEARAEIGDRGQPEDQTGPDDDRQPGGDDARHDAMLDSAADIGGRVREPGASPGRSRRCEGRSCATTMPLADAGKAVEQGAPSQKTCRPSIRTPRGRRIRASTHSHAQRGRGARAHDRGRGIRPRIVRVRVEGKSSTIFGATQPRASATTAMGALESASIGGEFYYHVQVTGFGPYVDQIGRNLAAGASGWAFKVNGTSPPVGADQVAVKDGDVVLWYWATSRRRAARRPSTSRARETAATASWRGTTPARRSPSPPRCASTAGGCRCRAAGRVPGRIGASCGRRRPAPYGRMR